MHCNPSAMLQQRLHPCPTAGLQRNRSGVQRLLPSPSGQLVAHQLSPDAHCCSLLATSHVTQQQRQQHAARSQLHCCVASTSGQAATSPGRTLPPQLAPPRAPDEYCVVNFYHLVDLEDPQQVRRWRCRGSLCGAARRPHGGVHDVHCIRTGPHRTQSNS